MGDEDVNGMKNWSFVDIVTVLVIRRSTFVLFLHSVSNKGDVFSDKETTQDLCRNNTMRDVGECGIK
jgi:hypothetical protein